MTHLKTNSVNLRDYQLDAISKCRELIRAGKKKIVLVLPTGAGKTTIAAEIIRTASLKGSKIGFLAHRKELIDQASKRLDDMGVDHGVCKSSHPRTDPRKPVQVASVQSLVNRTQVYRFDIIFIDECHRANAGTYKKILDQYPDACVIGLTATPYRSDGQGLGDVFEEMVVVKTMTSLISEGHLIRPRYFSRKMDISSFKSKGSDIDQDDLGTQLSKPSFTGDLVAEWRRHASGRTTVLFASTVDHSKKCVEAFIENGVKAEHLDATMKDHEREAILSRLASGETTLVSNVGILSEGWDLPKTSCCVVATLTLSRMKWMQMAGRVLRPCPEEGKADALIIDHYGNCFVHGPVEIEISLNLNGTEKVTKKKAEDNIKAAKICKTCFAPNPSDFSHCQVCNSPLSVQKKHTTTGKGELMEISDSLPKQIIVKVVSDSDEHHLLFVDGDRIGRVSSSKYRTGIWNMLSYCGGGYYSHSGGVRVKWHGPISYLTALGKQAASVEHMKAYFNNMKEVAKEKGYKPGWANMRLIGKYGIGKI